MSNNYLLVCDIRDEIWEKLIQLKAISGLICEVTAPHQDGSNHNINAAAWLISEQLEKILTNIESLKPEHVTEE